MNDIAIAIFGCMIGMILSHGLIGSDIIRQLTRIADALEKKP